MYVIVVFVAIIQILKTIFRALDLCCLVDTWNLNPYPCYLVTLIPRLAATIIVKPTFKFKLFLKLFNFIIKKLVYFGQTNFVMTSLIEDRRFISTQGMNNSVYLSRTEKQRKTGYGNKTCRKLENQPVVKVTLLCHTRFHCCSANCSWNCTHKATCWLIQFY